MRCINDSSEFECQRQRSKVKVTRVEKRKTAESSPMTVQGKARRAVHCKPYDARSSADDSIVWPPEVTG